MKKTRKIKNKKLFLKWLKKSRSHINKYSIKHGGEGDDEKGINVLSSNSDSSDSPPLKDENIFKKKAIILAGIVTLGDIAYGLASNPIVVAAVVGLGVSSQAFLGIATGGGLLVLSAVLLYATMKIKIAYNNYHKMIHVMNDLIILLQKIDNMVRVAIKISQQYKFVIDTKDVNKSLERIFSRFDTLLSIEDKNKIKQDIENNASSFDSKIKSAAQEANIEEVKSLDNEEKIEDPKEIEVNLTFFQKLKLKIKTTKQNITKTFKVVKLNSKNFTDKINQEVMKLGLYFSILLGEFNIILNVCQMNIIGERDFTLLLTQNGIIKNSEDFKKLLISSLIYRTLQIYNIFTLCKPSASISSETRDTICSEYSMKQYIIELEAERVKIRKVLFGKSISDNQILFPLYIDYDVGRNGDISLLNQLRQVMKQYGTVINDNDTATKFVNEIYKFNEKNSAGTKKTISNSAIEQLVEGKDYREDIGDD